MLDKNKKKCLMLFFAVILISGCAGSNVSVKSNIPRPLVNQLPLVTYLSYTDEFKNYQYQESEKSRSLSSLSFGPAQTELFNRIFSELVVMTPTVNDPSLDLIIEPEILDLQYTSPSETKLNLYEVWLRYRVKISDAKNNKVLADWVVKGYGKTPTATLKTTSLAFNAATNIALRDVGAQLAIGFPSQPAIKTLLGQKKSQLQTNEERIVGEVISNEGQ
ncbi:MAG: hypothetical protein KTR16_16225 [Acidiferrobacterales bacterium]|nr:hypothetical protein [Acidiferrobacterales bacterium]